MSRQIFLSIFFLFSSFFSVSCRAEFSPSDACNGMVACGLGCAVTVAGVAGVFLTEELFSKCHDYSPVPWIFYGASFVIVAGGLSLMYQGFKKIVGRAPGNKKGINAEDFELVPVSQV